MTATMRAATYSRYGDPTVVAWEEVPVPPPGPGEMLVRVAAAGINPLDWKLLRGDFALMRGRRWPRRLGTDLAGTVAAIGPGVTRFRVGDRVFGAIGGFLRGERGTFAEQVIAAEKEIHPLPAGIDLALAAALPVAGCSALQCLELADARAGASLLVIGAAGGVGSCVTALAAARGMKVTASCRATQADYARRLGAAEVIARDDGELLRTARRFDAIIDAATAYDFARCAPLLQPRGRYVITMPNARHYFSVWRSRLLGGRQARALMMELTSDRLRLLAEAAASGALASLAVERRHWSELPAALDRSRAGSLDGKLVVEFDRVN